MEKGLSYLRDFITEQPVFSTHQHHLKKEEHQNLNLDVLLQKSYVSWCSLPSNHSKIERERWLNSIRLNSYFVWLEKGLKDIYGINRITADNWDEISEQISKTHEDPDAHIKILKKHGNYIGFMEDSYWDPGSNIGYPEFITGAFRIDMWLQGFHPESRDHDGYNPHSFYGEMSDFDSYISRFKEEISNRKSKIVALKCASAYERDIAFNNPDYNKAKNVFGKHPSKVTPIEKNDFGNYIFHIALEVAQQLDLPIQIHTGLAQLKGSNPLLLEEVISKNPKVRFVLFHGGFPWVNETAALAHNYDNVIIDINWLPLISTSVAEQSLHMYIETLRDNNHIAWGADTWTSEEAVGASFAFKHILFKVLSNKIQNKYMNKEDAVRFAKQIMFENALGIYGIRDNK